MMNHDIDKRYGQRRLHDSVVAAVWRGGDHHAIAMRHGVDIRSVRKIWQTLITEPGRLHMQVDDDIETIADAIVADTKVDAAIAREIAMWTLLRWYANGKVVSVPQYAQIRLMASAWAQSRIAQESDGKNY